MKVAISGGHFSPAYALITSQYIKDCVVLGRKSAFEKDMSESLEYALCRKLSIPFEEIRAGRINRKLNYNSALSALKLSVGMLDSIKALKKHKPDIVLSFGGYIGFSASVAAYILKIPVVIHEQTQKAGLSNRLSGRLAKKICVAFEDSQKYFPKRKIIITGNPLRNEIFTEKNKIKGITKPLIYVTGGSTGAAALNKLVFETLDELAKDFTVLHQTGNSSLTLDFEKAKEIRRNLLKNMQDKYIIRDFIMPDEIGFVLKNADLIVSRSGINTVMELVALEKKALLIPLPYGQEGEQLENAKFYSSLGLGEFIEQKSLTPKIFAAKIKEIFKSTKYKMKKSDKDKFIIKDASKKLYNALELVYETSRKEKN